MKKVTLTSAVPLDQSLIKIIEKKLASKFNEFELEKIVDPSVIGGISITIGSTQIDQTISSQLDNLKKQLQ